MKKLSFFLMAMLMSVMSFAAEINLDFTKIDGFSSWKNSYSEHVVEYDDATVTFTAASRQTGTITTQPVTKGQPVEVVMKNDITLSGVTFACTQWGSKAQTITLHYSVDGGKNYTSTGITSTDFNISSEELPLGTNAVKLTFSSSSSQIGIASCTLVTVEANPDAPKYMVTATPSDEAMGTVTGGGEYGEGSVVTLTATPKAGYKFVNWSNGSTDNPLVLEVTEDVNITANFAAKDVYTITWSVNGETTTTSVVEGEALVLPEAPEAPEACSEKVFVGWTTAEEVNADGSDITWVDETVIPTNSVTYYAVFATVEGEEAQETSITKTVKEYAEANSWANETQYKTMVIDENITITITEEGTYHNSGKYYLNGNNWRIYQNETPTLTFSAQEGTINAVTTEYTYKNGGVLTHNGTNVTSGTEYKVEASTITFGVGSTEAEQTKGNVQITEITVVYTAQVNIYTDYSTTCVAPVVNHTITVSANPAEGGVVTGGDEYEEGATAILTATANEGYEFVNWTENEVEVSTDAEYTFEVLADRALVANFKEVEPVKLYLNAKDWGYGDARFAAYFFDPAKWVDMTKVEGETYIYEVEVPAGYTKVIFVRMNGSTTENNWGNKWNQTGNLDIPTDGKNMFKPDDWDGKTTTWSTYTPSVKYTFTKGSTWYIDFSAITGKKGANYPKADVADIDYSANAGGTVIPVTFTADVTWAEGATFIKTEEGGWDALTFTTPTEGANCAQVAADGKSYTWTTYVPVVIYTVTATVNPAETGTVAGAGKYEEGTEITLTATPAEGYEFVNWTKGEEVVSTENSYTFVVTADVALVANFAVVEPEVITYELNGGELVVEVPTQEELWASFKTAAGLTTLGTLAEITEAGAGKPHNDPDNPCACRIICAKLLDANVNAVFALPEWAWLKAYIMTVQSGLPEASSSPWRYAIAAFFLQSQHSAYPASADFTEAGKPEAWGAAYQAAHAVVLPTEPVDAPYTLPTPVKDGFTFVGWYDNAEGTGEAYTVIPAGWAGTLYAIWEQGTTTALENIAVEGKAVKAIVNGQLIIIKNGVQYNAQGAVVK